MQCPALLQVFFHCFSLTYPSPHPLTTAHHSHSSIQICLFVYIITNEFCTGISTGVTEWRGSVDFIQWICTWLCSWMAHQVCSPSNNTLGQTTKDSRHAWHADITGAGSACPQHTLLKLYVNVVFSLQLFTSLSQISVLSFTFSKQLVSW